MNPIGQTVFRSLVVFSEWFPSFGDNASLAADVAAVNNGATLGIDVYHKAAADAGNGALLVAFPVINAPGVTKQTATGVKELVRYRFTVGGPGVNPDEWVHFRMLEPAWFNTSG